MSVGDERKEDGESPSELIGMCMHEVRNLESTAFERIHQVKELLNGQIEEVNSRLRNLY
eukprot:CAMPEP_0172926338 /NCGR_PEP_ID=MMETSP1075-20121228/215432_1 /TAXON_ID=2916 /ORGANISM="Ceratium fusus, Strain PA161109" /LENGTH=58 /DNA_ID=CAMNT_0013787385 /DNA_START=18 /DNA_END=191 /DNA_ORIENTATION=-